MPGRPLRKGLELCRVCADARQSQTFPDVLAKGRLTANGAEAQKKRAETQGKHAQAVSRWKPEDHPQWLSEDVYTQRIIPRLQSVRAAHVARALSISESYAALIKTGLRIPHPRHWPMLASLCGVLGDHEAAVTRTRSPQALSTRPWSR